MGGGDQVGPCLLGRLTGDLLAGDHLLGTLLGLLEDILGLALGVRDDLVAGLDNGFRLLQLTGELIADLVEQVEYLVAFDNALFIAQRQAPCVLHHLI